MTTKTITAIIPARGGSKGLPRKNIRPLNGKPLIAWSIDAARASKKITHVFVSTDDAEIAAIAKSHGCPVLDRPADLASDTAQNHHVLLDAVSRLPEPADILVLLQPTSPLRTGNDIDACLDALLSGNAHSATTVCECEHHPAKAMTMTDGHLAPFTNWDDAEARRQDLRPAYRQNGAVYAIYTQDFVAAQKFLVAPVAATIMPQDRSIDIDTENDLIRAEAALKGTL